MVVLVLDIIKIEFKHVESHRPTRTFPAAASTPSLHHNPNHPKSLRDSTLNRFAIALL